jgi:hypothetical protein
MILHLKNEVSRELCQRFIGLAASDFIPAGVIGAEKMSKVTSDIALVEQYGADKTWLNGDKVYFWPSHPRYDEVRALSLATLTPLVEKYCASTGYEMPPWAIDYFSIIRYQEGGFFRPHQDSIWQPNRQQRTITVIVYLNDDYEGGNLVFADRQMNIQPAIGDVVIFPCGPEYIHLSRPIMSGTKYALTLWPLVDRATVEGEEYVDREQLTVGK